MIDRRTLLIKSALLTILGNSFLNKGYTKYTDHFKYQNPIRKKILNSDNKISSIGMGTWLTFDIGYNTKKLLQRTEVLKVFFGCGGEMIDSSPMYGTSERVIGKCLDNIDKNYKLFSATKVWTPNTWHGVKQIENSLEYWKLKNIDLLQVHNLVNYEGHLEKLFQYKKDGKIKYLGITTSHGWRHEKTKKVMEKYDLDFIQLTYNIVDREAEKYLLDLAYEKKISVIANRPFQGGNLFSAVKNKKLPEWAKSRGIKTWANFFLKYIISNKSVICAIPATTRTDHMLENMEAMYGFYPDYKFRKDMENYIKNI